MVLFQVVVEEPRDPGLASTRVLGRHMRGCWPATNPRVVCGRQRFQVPLRSNLDRDTEG